MSEDECMEILYHRFGKEIMSKVPVPPSVSGPPAWSPLPEPRGDGILRVGARAGCKRAVPAVGVGGGEGVFLHRIPRHGRLQQRCAPPAQPHPRARRPPLSAANVEYVFAGVLGRIFATSKKNKP